MPQRGATSFCDGEGIPRPAVPRRPRSPAGGRENTSNEASVFLHTADTYVVANDTVKYQGKSPSGGLEARFPPDIVVAFVGLLPAPLIAERRVPPAPGPRGLPVQETPVGQVRGCGPR